MLVQTPVSPALLQVAASGEGATISGYLSRCKGGKRHWKKRWFVIKGKVLYTYMANEVPCNLASSTSLSPLLCSLQAAQVAVEPGGSSGSRGRETATRAFLMCFLSSQSLSFFNSFSFVNSSNTHKPEV